MEVKEKNKKLLIVVGVLLLFGGISLAYFISKAILGGNGGSTSVTTAVINGAILNVEGVLSFEDLDILPGHKTVSSIKVTATGNNELIPYNLIWQGTNTLTTPLNFTIYKTSEQLSVTSTCNKKTKIINGAQALSEECKISNIDKLGNEIATGTINKNETKVSLVKDEFITATSTGDIKYYYIILEYPNLDEPQNEDLNGIFEGEVTVEESNIKPDINILAAYVVQDDGTYKEVEDIPQEGYTINQEKSTCSNGAIPSWDNKNKGLLTTNLTKSGTSCYLYFDKYVPTGSEIILANLGTSIKTDAPDFSQIATIDEGVYSVGDPVYGGTSYYWRGAVINNYLKFANKCWRIVRINGDGSIRLIYDGSTCHANGISTTESIAKIGIAYNTSYDQSNYVGWTYEGRLQRPTSETSGIASNAKTELESWYNTNITGANDSKVARGKYCNDRNTESTWAINGSSTFYYAAFTRSSNNSPTLSCQSVDIYQLNVGLITADEVMYAGGRGTNNTLYYLYNGQYYWTISPHYWLSNGRACMFIVNVNGNLTTYPVFSTDLGLRPVINLKSDVTFSDGDGTLNNPYIVAN